MKKKIIALFALMAIVACAMVGFMGCNGVSSVNPVDNTEFVKSIRTTVWNEGAKRYDDFSDNNPNISVAELTSGSQSARYHEIHIKAMKNVFDGYEFFKVEFDIIADRDVDVTINLYYEGGLEANRRHSTTVSLEATRRHSTTVSLKANEKVHQEWDLTKNIVMANGDKSGIIMIKFEGEPASNSNAFKAWSQTQYSISNLEFYAVEIN